MKARHVIGESPWNPYDTAPLKRLSSTILLFCLLMCSAAIARPQVVLITIGPGDEVYEKFGHDLLWINDPDRHLSICYHWGLFDFDQPNFILNFARGRMTYSMGAFDPNRTMAEYLYQKRHVTMQRLDLTEAEANQMIALCETNRLPQNADYRYDYFKDNCSTRARDMIDQSTGGRFTRQCLDNAKPSGMSFRQHTLRLMQNDFWVSVGIDFCLGSSGDIPLTPRQECFLPMRLAAFAGPMTLDESVPWPSDRPAEPQTVPNRTPLWAGVGFGLGALLLAVGRWRDWAGRWLIGVWLFLSGTAGVFVLSMWAFTDHVATYANQNSLYLSPLAWIALAFLIFRRRRWAMKITMAIVVVSIVSLLLKFVGVFAQQNGPFIALAFPLNLAAVVILRPRQLTPAPQPSEVTPT